MTLQPVEPPREHAGPPRVAPVVTFGDDDLTALSPSCVAALLESGPEMATILSRATVSVGLEWNPPPCPEPLRLDDWYLRVGRAGSQHPAPVPFFPEVHEEVTRTACTGCTSPRTASIPSGRGQTLRFYGQVFP